MNNVIIKTVKLSSGNVRWHSTTLSGANAQNINSTPYITEIADALY